MSAKKKKYIGFIKSYAILAALTGIAYLIWGKLALIGLALILSTLLYALMEFAFTEVEKRIITFIKAPVRIIIGFFFVPSLLCFAILVINGSFQTTEFHVNNDADAVRFSNSRSNFATIHSGQLYDSGYILTSKTSLGSGFFAGGMYFETPATGNDSSKTETEDVFYIEFDSHAVVYVVHEREPLPRDGEKLYVRKADKSLQDYYDDILVRILASDIGVDEEAFREIVLPVVLQPATGINERERLANIGIVSIAIFVTCAFICLVIPKLPFIKRRSRFGKLISKREDFSIIERKINEQIKNPVFKDDKITITQDYIIGNSKSVKGGFWYLDQLVAADIEEHKVFDDGDIQYSVSLHTDDDEVFSFLTLEIEAIEGLIQSIEWDDESE